MAKYQNIVIDTNNLFWRASHKTIEEFMEFGKTKLYIGTIRNLLEKVKWITDKYARENTQFYFLFDNPTSKIKQRKLISSEYKHTRKSRKMPEHFYKTLLIVEEILKNYSEKYSILWGESKEADDLTCPLKKYIEPSYHNRILFVSNDMDWARNIDDFCDWHDWKRVVSKQQFYQTYEFFPESEKIKMYKTIRGDKSDNIKPGLPNLPKEHLLYILETYGNINELLDKLAYDKKLPGKWKGTIKDRRSELMINYQLVDFSEIDGDIHDFIYKCTSNERQARIWFEILGLPLEEWMVEVDNSPEAFFRHPDYKYV